jgi:bifunctional non-homologous end joining protein LigD
VKRAKANPPESLEFSNEDKIMFPALGLTKGDILRFYERISTKLLPHLRDRPITLERLPDGLTGRASTHFWQKDTPSYYPAWIQRIKIAKENDEPVSYALVNNVQTLLYLVNQGTITFHPWFSRINSLDRPDFVVFDLDPGEASFEEVIAIAKELHRLLGRLSYRSFVKTSGKSGLHVLVAWLEEGGYGTARSFALNVAERIVDKLPRIATIERSKAKRRGKVYVDVMQNVRGHHAVPPYVLRAVAEATVSTPLRWRELTTKSDPKDYNVKTIFRRLARQKSDPLTALLKSFRN